MNRIHCLLLLVGLGLLSCSKKDLSAENSDTSPPLPTDAPFLVVLGVAQDAGFPQANCQKSCCAEAWHKKERRKMVSCLGLVDPQTQQSWLFDATPDFKEQWRYVTETYATRLAGIFLTHAHMGHYTGLMHLGREAVGAVQVPVFVMPRMKSFLTQNGPWSQLISLKNIQLKDLQADSTIRLSERIQITPYQVPHRDEFSETVGFRIDYGEKSAIFIPDIDKWNLWEKDIVEIIKTVDLAFLDGTFFENGEIPGRDMSLIPHPFVEESIKLFSNLEQRERAKIHFIHFNHTNPLMQPQSQAQKAVSAAGLNVAKEFQVY